MARPNRSTKITPHGEQVLCFIKETVAETNQFPTRIEIARHMGWHVRGEYDRRAQVLQHLLYLAGAGVLKKSCKKGRFSFELADDA